MIDMLYLTIEKKLNCPQESGIQALIQMPLEQHGLTLLFNLIPMQLNLIALEQERLQLL